MVTGKLEAVTEAKAAEFPPVSLDRYGFSVRCFRLSPIETGPRTASSYSLILHCSPPAVVDWYHGRHCYTRELQPGSISLHAPGELPGFRLHQEAELLEVAISPLFAGQVLQEDLPRENETIQEAYGVHDPQLQYIGLALRAELYAACPGGPLFAESLVTALTARLFSAYGQPVQDRTRRLSPSELRKVLYFISDHLGDDLSLNALAALTPYSPHYFALLFKQALGISPHQCVLRERIEAARRMLDSGQIPLGEIAYRIGFANQSHFNLHFKRLTGVTPSQYRNVLQEKHPRCE